MMAFQPLNTDFILHIDREGKTYRLRATLEYVGDSIERWYVQAGDKQLYFQNDRPERMRTKSNRVVKWKILAGKEHIKDPKAGALYLMDIWQKIELLSGEKPPTFQQVRTKS